MYFRVKTNKWDFRLWLYMYKNGTWDRRLLIGLRPHLRVASLMGGRTKKNGGRLGPRPSVQETQTTPSVRSVAPTNPPQKVSGDR